VSDSKPVIGLAGGIGSGKSTVARLMAREGGSVFDADAAAQAALDSEDVRRRLAAWWGEAMLRPDGSVDRAAVSRRVFDDAEARQRLEGLIHPLVGEARQRHIEAAAGDPAVRFIVLDVPLLFEVGLDAECDTVVFVRAPRQQRLARVAANRGWGADELDRREKNQWPLDKKLQRAHHILDNDGDEADCLARVRDLLRRIL